MKEIMKRKELSRVMSSRKGFKQAFKSTRGLGLGLGLGPGGGGGSGSGPGSRGGSISVTPISSTRVSVSGPATSSSFLAGTTDKGGGTGTGGGTARDLFLSQGMGGGVASVVAAVHGHPDHDSDSDSEVPPLLAQARPPPVEAEPWAIASGADIYTCFAEMSEFTGTYSVEAAYMRRPLQDRDERLIRNGFMRQARGDFLDLRRMVQADRDKHAYLTGQKKGGKGGTSKGTSGRHGVKHKGASPGRSNKTDKSRKFPSSSSHGMDMSTHGTVMGDETEGDTEGGDMTSRLDTPEGPGLRHSHSHSHLSGGIGSPPPVGYYRPSDLALPLSMLGETGAGWWCPSTGGQGYGREGGDDQSSGGGSIGSHSFIEGFGQVLNPVLAEQGMHSMGRPPNSFHSPSKITAQTPLGDELPHNSATGEEMSFRRRRKGYGNCLLETWRPFAVYHQKSAWYGGKKPVARRRGQPIATSTNNKRMTTEEHDELVEGREHNLGMMKQRSVEVAQKVSIRLLRFMVREGMPAPPPIPGITHPVNLPSPFSRIPYGQHTLSTYIINHILTTFPFPPPPPHTPSRFLPSQTKVCLLNSFKATNNSPPWPPPWTEPKTVTNNDEIF